MTAIPAGPRAPVLLQTLRWLSRPIPMLEDCRQRYGDVFTIRLASFPPIVLFSDPAAVKQIFTADPENLRAGEANVVLAPFLGTDSPYEFFPFGGGNRACLGAAFATFEMKIVLARMLARLELRAVPGYRARIVRRGIAFAPSEGMPVVVERRAA